MPTYSRNPAYTYPVIDHDVTIWDATVATDRVLTEATLTYSTPSGAFQVGETITESVSGKTGVLYWDTGSTIGLIDVDGDFTGGETLTGGTSTETATGGVATNKLTRTADTPVYTALRQYAAVSSSGPGNDQTVAIDGLAEWLVILNVTGATVTVCNGTSATPVMILTAGGDPYRMRLDKKRFAKLVLQFSAAGTCDVYQFDSTENPVP